MSEQFPAVESFEGGPDGLRDAYKRATARIRDLEGTVTEQSGKLRGVSIVEAGFPKDSPGYALLHDLYDGDLSSTEDVTAFAEKYGHKPGANQPKGDGNGQPDPTQEGDERLGGLQSAGAPVQSATKVDALKTEIAKAESEGRLKDAISLKNQLQAIRVPRT